MGVCFAVGEYEHADPAYAQKLRDHTDVLVDALLSHEQMPCAGADALTAWRAGSSSAVSTLRTVAGSYSRAADGEAMFAARAPEPQHGPLRLMEQLRRLTFGRTPGR